MTGLAPGFPRFKAHRNLKVARATKRKQRAGDERVEKAKVRQRDRYCRFPLCGCQKLGLALEVSHSRHKGAGGDPTGQRSQADWMVYLCCGRHRTNKFAVDQGTLRWCALSPEGADGAILWQAHVMSFSSHVPAVMGWVTLATETAPHVFEPFTPEQACFLRKLAEMTL